MKIFKRITKEVLFETEAQTTAETVISAVKYGANLSRADLYGANLYGADLSRANLSRADLSGANLYGANLSRADLSGANLSRANLSRADLYGADLSGANLSRADLSGANLSGANLSGANLSRANLYGANLYGANGVIRITGSQHEVFANSVSIWVGCQQFEYGTWQESIEAIGESNDYTVEQIQEYRRYLQLCEDTFAKLVVADPVAEKPSLLPADGLHR